uniref:Uncharacterized protein n=1 Tax=Arion vulgaris TaxID=1028688 RepID=A0A0B6Z8P8_9EUPU
MIANTRDIDLWRSMIFYAASQQLISEFNEILIRIFQPCVAQGVQGTVTVQPTKPVVRGD